MKAHLLHLCVAIAVAAGLASAHAAEAKAPKATAPVAKADPAANTEKLRAELLKEKLGASITVLRPDGKPAAGAAVSLVTMVDGVPIGRTRGKADASGVARFDGVADGPRARQVATAPYGGVNYEVVLERSKKGAPVTATLQLAETTEKASAIRIGRAHIVVDAGRDGIKVSELMMIENAGKETYAGKPLKMTLFPGAKSFGGEAAQAGAVRFAGDHVELTAYLRPGQTPIQFEYTLPLSGTFHRHTPLPIGQLFVVSTKPAFGLRGSSIRSSKTVSERGTTFLLAEAGAVGAGGHIEFELVPPQGMAGAGGPSSAAEGAAVTPPRPGPGGGKEPPKGELVKDWRTVARWLTPAFAIFIFFMVIWAAGRGSQSDLGDPSALSAEREVLLAELALVAPRARSGEKPALRRETELLRRLADLYRALDEHEAAKALQSVSDPAALTKVGGSSAQPKSA